MLTTLKINFDHSFPECREMATASQSRGESSYADVQSHLIYMLPIYGECVKYKLKELQVIQNHCVKAMFRR